nr:DUF308 domain-containing protein [uncultured Butyrivibrio sp.]
MTNIQKINNVVLGIISIAVAIYMIIDPQDGYLLMLFILSFSLAFRGLKELFYFFTMGRHMVGGRLSLYKGVFLLDIGFFTGSLIDIPKTYVMIYLVIINAFAGLVEILRVMETRRYGSKSWKLKFSHGIINILLAVFCIVFIKHQRTVILVYALGLIYSALIRIVSAFRKTAFIFIQ